MEDLERRLAVARGDMPADLVVRGGRVLSVFTREWLEVDVAVADGHVVGLGSYRGRRALDVGGAYVVPGLIDPHLHIESSKLMFDQRFVIRPHLSAEVNAEPAPVVEAPTRRSYRSSARTGNGPRSRGRWSGGCLPRMTR